VALKASKELEDCIEAEVVVTVEGENAVKPCCVAEWLIRLYS
jgi:hypothetical protein